jgi:hypothetical protein
MILLGATALSHVVHMDATIEAMDEVDFGDTIVILPKHPVVSTLFTFTLPDITDLINEDVDWHAEIYLNNFASNSTNHYMEKASVCVSNHVPVSADTYTLTHVSAGDNLSNTTLSFKVSADSFAKFNEKYVYEVICDVAYGHQSSSSATATASAAVKPSVGHDEHYYGDDDVGFPASSFAIIGSYNLFTATITHPTQDLSEYGNGLYDMMKNDLVAKAEEIHHDSAVAVAANLDTFMDVTHHDSLNLTGNVMCGLQSAVIGSGSGYACFSIVNVTFAGDMLELASIQDGYNDIINSTLSEYGMPSDTVIDSKFNIKIITGTCTDGYREFEEASVDCGYLACGKTCTIGQSCDLAADCSTLRCIHGKCSNSASTVTAMAAMAMITAVVALVM